MHAIWTRIPELLLIADKTERPEDWLAFVLAAPVLGRFMTQEGNRELVELQKDRFVVRYDRVDKIVWKLNGLLHRRRGPAVERKDGSYSWFIEGNLHRLDGPARYVQSACKEWWVDGRRHRVGGPAVEYSGGTYQEWWVEGKKKDARCVWSGRYRIFP